MEGWSLYEEDRRDGIIPETVLAIHNSEFEKQRRQPGYRPAIYTMRNPRKIKQERKEQEAEAALRTSNNNLNIPAATRLTAYV